MATAEVAEALRLAMTQQMMSGLSFHPFEALMYLAPATSVWLFLGIFTLEWPTIIAKNHLSVVVEHPLKFLAASTLGFMVSTLVPASEDAELSTLPAVVPGTSQVHAAVHATPPTPVRPNEGPASAPRHPSLQPPDYSAVT
jgi:hypothetical protein